MRCFPRCVLASHKAHDVTTTTTRRKINRKETRAFPPRNSALALARVNSREEGARIIVSLPWVFFDDFSRNFFFFLLFDSSSSSSSSVLYCVCIPLRFIPYEKIMNRSSSSSSSFRRFVSVNVLMSRFLLLLDALIVCGYVFPLKYSMIRCVYEQTRGRNVQKSEGNWAELLRHRGGVRV